MIALDASVLIEIFHKKESDRRLKIEHLLQMAEKRRETIVVPAPALCELLAGSGKAKEKILEALSGKKSIVIRSFDQMAALECAIMMSEAKAVPKKSSPKSKIKFDWQIVAIAVTSRATEIYSFDDDIRRCAKIRGLKYINPDSLDLPPEAKQHKLKLEQR